LGGELPQAILKYNAYDPHNPIPTAFDLEAADKIVEEYKSIFEVTISGITIKWP
jgi:hypothetical protein